MRATFNTLPTFSDHVLCDGAFDPLHSGHLAYLTAAAALAKGPILCAVASDQQIREKGREPLLPQETRVAVMEALGIVSAVYAKDRPTDQVIETMCPRAYVKGADWEDLLPPEQVSACGRVGTSLVFVDTPEDSSTARLRAWARSEDAKHLDALEKLVQSQRPAEQPWEPVTDYSFEARKAIEGKQPELIKDVFHPLRVLDVGCGDGHLMTLLEDLGVKCIGMDPRTGDRLLSARIGNDGIGYEWPNENWGHSLVEHYRSDLVICREVLEHLTAREIRHAVHNLCRLSSKFVYVTTRFAKDPAHLLSVDTSDDLDPTHITMLNQDLLRALFVLEGAKRRADLEQRMDWQGKGRVLVYEVAR